MEELGNCPWMDYGEHELGTEEVYPEEYAVTCTCGAQGPSCESPEAAEKAWNTRYVNLNCGGTGDADYIKSLGRK
ncbi:MAG: hypothetical protein PQJ60_10790 [Spirochaetales bacterium]|nr:hypothetical protein [Spirochaetales bacterium]